MRPRWVGVTRVVDPVAGRPYRAAGAGTKPGEPLLQLACQPHRVHRRAGWAHVHSIGLAFGDLVAVDILVNTGPHTSSLSSTMT